jgi:hypothetical protein
MARAKALPAEPRDTETVEKKARFVVALRQKCSVFHAAQAAGVGRATVYRWRDDDTEFAAQWDDAIEDAVDALESSLYERALNGTDTTAAIFLLKGRRRPVFGDKASLEHTGKDGGPIETHNVLPVSEQATRLAALFEHVAQTAAN